ncbi:MAG: cupin domain-containing protein [Dehalococcoidia bacterium]
MAQAGDTIENPVTGERIVFRQTAADTSGELLEFDLVLQPHGFIPAEHVHARQEERVQVESGSVRYRLGGKEEGLNGGDSVTLRSGIRHTLWNPTDEEAHLIMQVRPALRTEMALETIFGLARDGKTNDKGMPNTLHAALLAREYELFLAGPPIAVQRAGMAVLAPIARLLGYRASYPEYSS